MHMLLSNNSEVYVSFQLKKSRVTIIRQQDFILSFFQLVTRKWKNKSLILKLLTRSEFFFQLRVSKLKVKK